MVNGIRLATNLYAACAVTHHPLVIWWWANMLFLPSTPDLFTAGKGSQRPWQNKHRLRMVANIHIPLLGKQLRACYLQDCDKELAHSMMYLGGVSKIGWNCSNLRTAQSSFHEIDYHRNWLYRILTRHFFQPYGPQRRRLQTCWSIDSLGLGFVFLVCQFQTDADAHWLREISEIL